MIEPTFKLRLEDVKDGFAGMTRKAERRRLFFESIKKPAKDDIREHQRQKRGESSAWPERQRQRGRKRRRRRGRLLGRLPTAWKSYLSDAHFKLRNMIRWSGIHDTGGRAGRGARIPRRQFAYLSRAFLDEALAAYGAFVIQGWKRR